MHASLCVKHEVCFRNLLRRSFVPLNRDHKQEFELCFTVGVCAFYQTECGANLIHTCSLRLLFFTLLDHRAKQYDSFFLPGVCDRRRIYYFIRFAFLSGSFSFSFVMRVFEIVMGAGLERSRNMRQDKELMPIRVSNFTKVDNFFVLVLQQRT